MAVDFHNRYYHADKIRELRYGVVTAHHTTQGDLIAHADSCDAMFGTYCRVIDQDDMPGEITARKNILGYALFKKDGKG